MSDQAPVHEAELMRRVTERDQTAFDALYDRYAPVVHRMALRILNQDEQAADEVVQDVFFQIWRWPEKWDADKGTFVNWLLTVTRNTAIDQHRRHQRYVQLPVDTIDAITQSSNQAEQRSDTRRLLLKLLKKLPREQKQVIMLAFLRDMTHQEIAAELDIPAGTVKSRLRLGMKKLRKAWLLLQERQS
jgi:RNA polymerase sigma-70 factor (ECF subfamily)